MSKSTDRASRKLGTSQALKISITPKWFGEIEQTTADTLRGLGFVKVVERSDLQGFAEGAIANALEDARVKGALAREEEEGRQREMELDAAAVTLAKHYGIGTANVKEAMEKAEQEAGTS